MTNKDLTAARSRSRFEYPRLIIENVYPQLDGGRHPVKRIVGDSCRVGADIYMDGHNLIAARVRYRGPNDRTWRSVAMSYNYNTDRWNAEFSLDVIGHWRFTVEAWPDSFGTWLEELRKKVAAGLDVSVELLEGAQVITNTLASSEHPELQSAAQQLSNPKLELEDRLKVAFAPELATNMAGLVNESEITRHRHEYHLMVDRPEARFAAWYEMFPRSQGTQPGKPGRFKDAEKSLPRLAELGFDVVYLPPIHPIGISHRKGPNNSLTAQPGDPGSPWAIGNSDGGHLAIAPELGTVEDFEQFVKKAADLGMEVALDYALQCSPDHPWIREHPDWFVIRPDGSIKHAENPPKKYEDIVPLDLWCEDRDNLWRACREILDYWIERGVNTFRVDNPHTKPFVFWEWLIASIKEAHPEVVFLSEAFTRPKKMQGLAKLGFTQSYTYFTWKNTAAELRELFTELHNTDLVEYFRGNLFTNTPDILHEYLQKGGRPAFRVRLLLAATLSPLYGIYSGFELCENVPREPGSEEYLNSEKYEIKVRDWEASGNINDDIRILNRIRRNNPALQTQGNLAFHPTDNEQLLFYSRNMWRDDLLILVNLDPHNRQAGMADVPVETLGLVRDSTYEVEDLLTGQRYTWRGVHNYVDLDPAARVGHVLRVVR
ncbi:MAG: alpha-1,4-glucan--maltose-1-phosphate maltosyltransferase [Gemmatimonas sp. SG8_17]|nr:MAG: alpha-1,4-glucan--maltose-1-phosphate maltosyltransferase [Gemmatimonas sp. SG8_17]